MQNTAYIKITECLPFTVRSALNRLSADTLEKIAEIRLRAGNITTVTLAGENLYITDTGLSKLPTRPVRVTAADVEEFIYKFCGGSVYAYENTVKAGYITRHGIRAGLCGTAVLKNGAVCGFSQITGVNIRLPHHIYGCAAALAEALRKSGFPGHAGVLVVSPPGVGKTTVLRDLAIHLSRPDAHAGSARKFYRICLIDERSELYLPEYFSGCAVDVFDGVPKAEGLECAARVMAPEIIICDEIGSKADADIIRNAHMGGIVFIASMHGASERDVFAKSAVRSLCEDGVFSHLYLLSREGESVSGKLIALDKALAPC